MKDKTYIIIILLIVIGGIIMTGIVHERVVASRDKGMATDWNADHKITGDADMDQYSWLNQVIENRTDWPAGAVEGQVIYRTDLDVVYVYDGTGWSRSNKRVNYWSADACGFTPSDSTISFSILTFTRLRNDEASEKAFYLPVYLPHGAVVTAAIVYGSDALNMWGLNRIALDSSSGDEMALWFVNQEVTEIDHATIDNSAYKYSIFVTLGANDMVYSARIKYTL